jgi:hypothetical protein
MGPLGKGGRPVLGRFPLMDDGNNHPGNAGLGLYGLITRFATTSVLARPREIAGQFGNGPAGGVRLFKGV